MPFVNMNKVQLGDVLVMQRGPEIVSQCVLFYQTRHLQSSKINEAS